MANNYDESFNVSDDKRIQNKCRRMRDNDTKIYPISIISPPPPPLLDISSLNDMKIDILWRRDSYYKRDFPF